MPAHDRKHVLLLVVLVSLVATLATADDTFPTGNCTADVLGMSGLRPSKGYPNATAMRSFTGAGDYGFTVYLGDWDPGKWQGCVELETAVYCVATYRQSVLSNQSVGVCVPSSCNGTELMKLSPGLAVEKLKLPVEFGSGFTAECIPKTAPLPAGAWVVIGFLCFLVVLVLIATATEYALNHQMVSFDISSSVNILIRGEEDPQPAGAHGDEEAMPIDPNAPGVKRRYISVIDDETAQELRAKAEAAKAAKRQRISNTLRRKGPIPLRVLLMWSATYNFERLIAHPPSDSLMCLNGIRVLSLVSVVLGHTYFFMWLCLSLTNIRYVFNTVAPKFFFQLIPATYYAVDSFFFMSGFLMAYLFIKQLQKHGLTLMTLPLLYLHRILRLTPSLALALMVYWQLAPYVSDGPTWRFFKQWVDNSCDSNWWKVLLYVQNLTEDSSEGNCMAWTWYLAVDMQLFLVSPLFLITYHNHRVAGWILTLCALLACIGSNLGIAWDNDLYAYPFLEALHDPRGAPPGGDIMTLIYMKPWTRAGPYLVGFISAYITLDHGDRMRIAPAYRTVLYILALMILGVLAFITYTDLHYGWSQAFNIVFIGFNRTLWGIGLAILVLMCVQRYWGVVRTALESPLWAPFARLSYAAYLYHLVVLGIVYMSQQSNYTYQFATAMYFFIGHTVGAYIIAFAHYMLFEKPLLNFEAMLLRRYAPQ